MQLDLFLAAVAVGCGVIVGFTLGLVGGGGSVLESSPNRTLRTCRAHLLPFERVEQPSCATENRHHSSQRLDRSFEQRSDI